MKILIMFILVISFFPSSGQEFLVKDSAGMIKIEIPRQYKAYTYNKYTLTDSSMIIRSVRDSIDLIIADFRNNKRIYFSFLNTNTSFVRAKDKYTISTTTPGTFSIFSPEDITLTIESKLSLKNNLIIDHKGTLSECRDTTLPKNKVIAGNHVYGYQFSTLSPGYYPLTIKLSKSGKLIEERIIPVIVEKAKVELMASYQLSEDNFQKMIEYVIAISPKNPVDIKLTICIELQIDGEKEVLSERIMIPSGIQRYSGKLVKHFHRRLPKIFQVKNILINDIFQHPNIDFVIR